MLGGGGQQLFFLAMGGITSFEVVLTHALQVLAMLKGARQKVRTHYIKWGRGQGGGGHRKV